MPMVGTPTAAVTCRATSGGIASSTMAYAPASAMRARVGDDLRRRLAAPALHLEAAERVHALRQEPHVTHHRNARAHDAPHVLGDLLAALELHALEGALLHQLACALDRLLRTRPGSS